jgi:DNA repair protein RadC
MKNVNHHQIAEIQLVYSSKIKASQRQTLSDPRNAEAILRQSWNPQTIELFEQFKVLLLSQANQVLGIYCASCGGVSQTVVDVKLLFCAALKANASAILRET